SLVPRQLRVCFFFFSSRRRHTRFSRDWSSDVCSSDLPALRGGRVAVECKDYGGKLQAAQWLREAETERGNDDAVAGLVVASVGRSEERRVGKECRSRGSPGH